MSTPTGDASVSPDDTDAIQPLRDKDTSIEPDPTLDPAQVEWDRTTALDDGVDPDELDPATRTGADPAEIRDDGEVPASDLPDDEAQPDTQGDDPITAELGDDGQGDLAPEDM